LSRLRIAAMSSLLLIIALTLVGCGRGVTIEYIPEGGTYSMADLEGLAHDVDIAVLEDVASSEIGETRQKYLTALRGHGEQASIVADTLTRDFPVDTLAVPLLVESGVVDEQNVWIVVEAWAEEGSTLLHRRVWLLDRDTMALVNSLSFR